jgi:hypothetical protein
MQLDTNYWTLHFKGIEYFILSQESKMVNLRSMVLCNLDLYGGLSLPTLACETKFSPPCKLGLASCVVKSIQLCSNPKFGMCLVFTPNYFYNGRTSTARSFGDFVNLKISRSNLLNVLIKIR